jgi:hypothetical protein
MVASPVTKQLIDKQISAVNMKLNEIFFILPGKVLTLDLEKYVHQLKGIIREGLGGQLPPPIIWKTILIL